ncbi:hypothetical protein [Corynebacterium haemomassiliense]|uniref:GAF domain-containing protein n=1 Tax=Corynebacterium haemomassiliense TaxID=2754726 RepID=A0A7W2I4R9_9CORY|nr:hypothetical protein [Corynebacterium haemomassiliense]MBA5245451.1 hypothetical protein [Corynebacterium haemomassiliense]
MRHRRRLLLTAEVFFVTVGPWIFTLVGGIFLSAAAANHSLGELIGVGSFWIGALLLLVGVGPLAVSTTHERWQREENESKHEREFATNQLAAFSIAKLPVSDQLDKQDRIDAYESACDELTNALAEEVFGAFNPRVIYFEHGEDENGDETLVPKSYSGCDDDLPRTHKVGEERFQRMLVLVRSDAETERQNGISGRKYRSFVSASVSGSGGSLAYGLLTVDTTMSMDFDERDESNLLTIARLLAAFRDAADRP